MAKNLQAGLRQSMKASREAGLTGDGVFSRAPLDLRFAMQKTLDPRVTFTRASSATFTGSDGLIKTAATDEPRFDHNPTTGESLGLLVEEARTNLVLRSEEFDNASWAKISSTISANAAAAPNGTTTADKLIVDNGQSAGYAAQSSSFTSGITWTVSCFAKASEVSDFRFVFESSAFGSNLNAVFNLSTGVVTSFTAGSASIQALPNGWYRCIATATTTATASASIQFRSVHAGNGTNGIFVWGAQLEAGAFPTSYIPTTTATVTRAADVASITGSNFSSWYNQTEGTMFAEYQQYAIGGTAVNFSDNTGSNFINIFTSSVANSRSSANVFTSGTNNGRLDNGGTFVANSSIRSAYGLSAGSRSLSAQGNTVSASATPGTLPTVNRANIGVNQDALSNWNNGTIKRLTYWPVRLANTTLQQITQP
jgi:hypothetical protein